MIDMFWMQESGIENVYMVSGYDNLYQSQFCIRVFIIKR